MAYGIGIDTGGTYTDAALMDLATGEVLAGAKRPTTHHDLALGIGAAVGAVLQGVDAARVTRVAVSTTLATNAVVEGRGARVALILIGQGRSFTLPVESVSHVRGGHTYAGAEAEPLDLEALAVAVEGFRGNVDAYVACASMSFANPAHELVAARAIALMDPGAPVFCSHQVSELPGMEERSATAVLNARLMPVMREFLDAVTGALAQLGVSCPVHVVRGDGAPMGLEQAVGGAAHTFASGPAATARFGARAADGGDVLVIDVGGTTTDVTLVTDGRPCIVQGGSRIGDWPTHVSSVSMHTAGVGGDSWVRPLGGSASGTLGVGPARVLPLAMAADLPGFADPASWMGVDGATRLVCLDPAADAIGLGPSARELGRAVVARLLADGPATPQRLMADLRVSSLALDAELARLAVRQRVALTGFTPTDALHVARGLDLGDGRAALAGAVGLARLAGLRDADALCARVLDAVAERIETAVLRHVLRREAGHDMGGLLDARRDFSFLDVRFGLRIPLVGLGAAGALLLPPVAKRLGTTIVFPEHHEIGNAVGALLMAVD
ncbi:MAG: hydantoinase/oxoprolinase family protein [Desulfovibrionaceae bacterium]|jgi:N-methylhydantoinase A/oxoprolinase/acetone carboxylase beta subunit|nr:hydantoinase/oxoprolinase family protein [Desulfovibrionaceae bacterium]